MVDIVGSFNEIGRQYKRVFVAILVIITATIALIAAFITLDAWGSMEHPGIDPPTIAHGVVTLFIFSSAITLCILGCHVASSLAQSGENLEFPGLHRHGVLARAALLALAATFLFAEIEIATLDPAFSLGLVGVIISGEGTLLALTMASGIAVASILSIFATRAFKDFLDDEKPEQLRVYGKAASGAFSTASVLGLIFSVGAPVATLLYRTLFVYVAMYIISGVIITFGSALFVITSRACFLLSRAFKSLKEMERLMNA